MITVKKDYIQKTFKTTLEAIAFASDIADNENCKKALNYIKYGNCNNFLSALDGFNKANWGIKFYLI